MRMHKKGHLEERLLSCAEILTVCDLSDKNMKSAAKLKDYFDFEKIFKNSNPVHLEIGCGKGKFICGLAKIKPAINFIACEKVSNVIIDACECALRENIKNVHFLNSAAEVLERYFKPKTVETIYLNFSNPLPKEGYKKQRLTHPKFLEIYRTVLKDGGKIIQKTDDKDFYLFSLESYRAAGYKISETCEDYAVPLADDVETEHERLFKERGKNIYRIVAEV
ncbi:MAG: tRNA (guanosine(46)-N7)-methyltransferase TrmB [Clostridia bacterium]|nr:tRNA (guanosine(46)-N7)-methyltransferase TrmB [Clostridia bacterium]